MKIKHDYSECHEYEIKAVDLYTVDQVLDLLENSHAWITPMVNLHGDVPYDCYVQTVVNEESITIAHLWNKGGSFSSKWIKNDSQSAS